MGFFPHRNIAVADGLLWWLYPTPEKIKVWLVFWLVVSTPLKNISQLALLFPIYGKIRNVPNQREVPLWKGKNDYNWIQLADFPWPSQIPEPWLSQFLGHVASFFVVGQTENHPWKSQEWPCLAGIRLPKSVCWFMLVPCSFSGKNTSH